MVRPAQGPLTPSPTSLRDDLLAIAQAAIAGAGAGRALATALPAASFASYLSRPLHVIAAGKAAASMAAAIVAAPGLTLERVLAVGTHRSPDLSSAILWQEASHPLPDERSLAAGLRARDIAARVPEHHTLLLLLSGGASALVAGVPDGLTLDDKRRTIELMMHAGADIGALNTVRKHLSSVKGGHLAALCRGATLTLAVSDVVGDDVSVIGSGPGVPDETTWLDAAAALERFGGAAHPTAVRARVAAGLRGEIPETPKPGSDALRRAAAAVIASRRDAVAAAEVAARVRGYRVAVLSEPVTGEARRAAIAWLAAARQAAGSAARVCVISAGETTVRVTGAGKGGRNQEFALALADPLAVMDQEALAASLGTDGIDGPTDAAGALVDRTTMARARLRGLAEPQAYLDANDAHTFFAALGDLIRTGPTDTNVGDVQILLVG